METIISLTDSGTIDSVAEAEEFISSVVARAELMNSNATRAKAFEMNSIHYAIRAARQFPEAYVSPGTSDSHGEMVEFAERSVVFDLAMRLSVSENTIRNSFHTTNALVTRLPRVWRLFSDGRISYPNAAIAADHLPDLPEGTEADMLYETAILEPAGRLTPTKFTVRARAARERVHPVSLEQRHHDERKKRRVYLEPAEDGMSWLHLYSDAATIARAYSRLDTTARHLRNTAESRTLEQLRTDIAGDLLTGTGTPYEVASHVNVTIPVTVLPNDEAARQAARITPAILDGYGPMDPVMAKDLISRAPSFRRIFTDPISSIPLTLEVGTYRPTRAQREWLRVRYGTCTAPGCNRQAEHTDADHLTDWQYNGPTSTENLIPASRNHHRLKHKAKITVARAPDGTITWKTPTGLSKNNDDPPF